MEKIITDIKYNRVHKHLNNILNECYDTFPSCSTFPKFYYNKYYIGGGFALFIMLSNGGIRVYYERFIDFGMSDKITEKELIEIIHEKFKIKKYAQKN